MSQLNSGTSQGGIYLATEGHTAQLQVVPAGLYSTETVCTVWSCLGSRYAETEYTNVRGVAPAATLGEPVPAAQLD